jgi:hypothetical protein
MKNPFKGIIYETLKGANGRWSKSALTMFTAWVVSIQMAMYNLYNSGFDYTVFATFIAVALGAKTMDSVAKKINHPKKDKEENENGNGEL